MIVMNYTPIHKIASIKNQFKLKHTDKHDFKRINKISWSIKHFYKYTYKDELQKKYIKYCI